MTIWSDAIETVWPGREGPDGLLPPLLLLLTVVTGLVDAASYLKLGHVFVANMTGNVVFLGFAIAGAGGLSIWQRSHWRWAFRTRPRAAWRCRSSRPRC
jgi:hypothetical protein